VHESRMLGSVGEKAEWLSYPTNSLHAILTVKATKRRAMRRAACNPTVITSGQKRDAY
jgi:hypothetical protein